MSFIGFGSVNSEVEKDTIHITTPSLDLSVDISNDCPSSNLWLWLVIATEYVIIVSLVYCVLGNWMTASMSCIPKHNVIRVIIAILIIPSIFIYICYVIGRACTKIYYHFYFIYVRSHDSRENYDQNIEIRVIPNTSSSAINNFGSTSTVDSRMNSNIPDTSPVAFDANIYFPSS